MLENPASPNNPPFQTERRVSPRQQASSIMYVKIGEHNGGVILNIGEGGLAVQAAMALIVDNLPPIRFQMSANRWIETTARIAWITESKRTAGLQFNGLSATACSQIRSWLASEQGDYQGTGSEENVSTRDAGPQEVIGHPEIELIDQAEDQAPSQTETDSTIWESAPISSSVGEDLDKEQDYETSLSGQQHSDIHILPSRVVAARLKRYLVDQRHRIRLYSLISEETQNVCSQLSELNFPGNATVSVEEFLNRVHRYEQFSEVLLSVVATGCFWGDPKLEPVWAKIVERVATAYTGYPGRPQWVRLRFYPSLLLLYAGGLALIAKDNYSGLAGLLLDPKISSEAGDYCLIEQLYATSVIEDEQFRTALCGETRYKLPVNAYLYAFLREPLREFIPSDREYSSIFDRFEYILALVWTDQNPSSTRVDWIPVDGPLGLFAAKALGRREASIIEQVDRELSDLGKSYPLLRSGLFGGSASRLRSAKQRIAAQLALQENRVALARRICGAR